MHRSDKWSWFDKRVPVAVNDPRSGPTEQVIYASQHQMTKKKIMHNQVPQNEASWDIPGSEDETEEVDEEKTRFGSPRAASDGTSNKRKGKQNKSNFDQGIPKRIALLYKEIEKNGVLEIRCKCPRRGPAERTSSTLQSDQDGERPTDPSKTSNIDSQINQKTQIPR